MSNSSDSDIKDTFSIELASDGHVKDISYHPPIKFNNIIQVFYQKNMDIIKFLI